jgi:hypothetical protein
MSTTATLLDQQPCGIRLRSSLDRYNMGLARWLAAHCGYSNLDEFHGHPPGTLQLHVMNGHADDGAAHIEVRWIRPTWGCIAMYGPISFEYLFRGWEVEGWIYPDPEDG